MSSSLDRKQQAWSALFSEPVDALVQRYTASVGFDQRLARFDIQASLAHARMLAAQHIIGAQDLADIERGMAEIDADIAAGRFDWKLELEDVHLNIEARLTQLVGDAGKRLHTGRSRNDQVATDIRLWLRDAIDRIQTALKRLRTSLVDVAEAHADTLMPGFTHLQVAQPVTFGHHLLAYVEMFGRDAERLVDCRRRVNRLPLGAAALAGTSYPLDRAMVAGELGFEGIAQNSLDAVSDRDFAIEFCAAAALVMVHVSRLSEELVLWMSPAFGFIDLPDRYCTGSSIMPQKKNPDVPELARGKTGRVVGHLTALLVLMKGQPLAYNKDNQEDKEPLFDTRHPARYPHPVCRHGARPPCECRGHARRRAQGLRHGHRSCGLSGEEGPGFSRCPRGGGACRARLHPSRTRPRRDEPGRTASAAPRRAGRRCRSADAARLGAIARHHRRHIASPGAGADCTAASGIDGVNWAA
uniref:Putative Argininosuccinate lyase n=1 Tax=mine drainage metagenome TaxID=410659 RepID=E6PVQ6_9ZZZZ